MSKGVREAAAIRKASYRLAPSGFLLVKLADDPKVQSTVQRAFHRRASSYEAPLIEIAGLRPLSEILRNRDEFTSCKVPQVKFPAGAVRRGFRNFNDAAYLEVASGDFGGKVDHQALNLRTRRALKSRDREIGKYLARLLFKAD